MVGLNHAHSATRPARRGGFSLIELVIVVVIIGIIAAIAIPRMSRGSQGAADSALAGNLSVLRNAIDLYQTEHQAYPAATAPDNTDAGFTRQLTKYTDAAGGGTATQAKDATHVYGPYLRKVPPLPVGSKKGTSSVKIALLENEAPGVTNDGWIYYPTTGEIKANLVDTEVDSKGVAYNTY